MRALSGLNCALELLLTVLLGPLDAFGRLWGAFHLLAWGLEPLVDLQVACNVVQIGSKVLLGGSEHQFGVDFCACFRHFSKSLACIDVNCRKCFPTHFLRCFIHFGLAQDCQKTNRFWHPRGMLHKGAYKIPSAMNFTLHKEPPKRPRTPSRPQDAPQMPLRRSRGEWRQP